MICAHLFAYIFIKFEHCNKKIQRNVYYVCNRDIYKPFMIKEIKRKSREHIKKKRKSREQKRGKENKRKNERN